MCFPEKCSRVRGRAAPTAGGPGRPAAWALSSDVWEPLPAEAERVPRGRLCCGSDLGLQPVRALRWLCVAPVWTGSTGHTPGGLSPRRAVHGNWSKCQVGTTWQPW